MSMNRILLPSTKEEEEPQYDYAFQHNILWIDTVYWTFRANLKEMDVDRYLYSNIIQFDNITAKFCLRILKKSSNVFSLQLIRKVRDQAPDAGYFLQVSFTIVGSTCLRKVAYMYHNNEKAEECFTLDDFYASVNINDEWMIKCVIWMNEFSRLNNECSKQQKDMLKKKIIKATNEVIENKIVKVVEELLEKKTVKAPDEGLKKKIVKAAGETLKKEKVKAADQVHQIKEMAFVINSRFDHFFMGRHSNTFADKKQTLFQRSFRYSRRLRTRIIKYKDYHEPKDSSHDLGMLLGYIKTGEERFISKKDCLILYTDAFYFGLNYVKLLCSDFIMKNIADVNFVIGVLIVTDLVNDEILRDFALEWISWHKKEVLNSVQWNNFKNRNYKLACSFTALMDPAYYKESNLEDDEPGQLFKYIICPKKMV